MFWSDAGIAAALWHLLTQPRASNLPDDYKPWVKLNKGAAPLLKDRRRELKWIIEAVADPATLGTIHHIYSFAHTQPPRTWAGETFLMGSTEYNLLLGTPCGEWVAEFLCLFGNQDEKQLGWKQIASVRLFTTSNAHNVIQYNVAWRVVDVDG